MQVLLLLAHRSLALGSSLPSLLRHFLEHDVNWVDLAALARQPDLDPLLALRQLERRCGLLDVSTSSRIEALSLPQFEELALALLEFRGVGELQTWLEQLEH